MYFTKEDLQDWVFENHEKYWDSEFNIKDMHCIEGEWATTIQHIKGDWYLRVFSIDRHNYVDFWDYPIEDYKIWTRDRKINKVIK